MNKTPNQMSMPLLGIDWGTTNRRAYVLDAQGNLVRQHNDELGILAVKGEFEKSLADLLRKLGLERTEVLMSGMVGSRNGWRQAPYLSTDQPLSALPDALVEVETALPNVRCRIVPGYRTVAANGMPDVMRGEETQVLGALALGATSAMSATNGWFVLPGTHSKWVRVEGGAITEILTFMTGELFALLSRHGTLAALMQEQQPVRSAFESGMSASRQGGFTHMAFGCRALVVTDAMPAAHAWSYLSGLLIGSELHEIRRRAADQGALAVQVIGSPVLAENYIAALQFFGMSARVWPPDDVYVAALRVLAGMQHDDDRKDHAYS
jgi:2-dehydro-3-deoxygalactonokinase